MTMREEFEAWFEPDPENRKGLAAWRTEDGYGPNAWYMQGCWKGWEAASAGKAELLEALQGLLSTWDAICNAKGWDKDHLQSAIDARALIAKHGGPQ